MPLTISLDQFRTLRDKIEKVSIHSRVQSKLIKSQRASTNGKGKLSTLKNRVQDLSASEQYRRKQSRQEIFRRLMQKDPEFKIFVQWIQQLQAKLKMSNVQFSKALGFMNSRMLMSYYKLDGHFPSEDTYRRLFELDRRSQIKVIEHKRLVNIPGKGITQTVKIPRSLRRDNHIILDRRR